MRSPLGSWLCEQMYLESNSMQCVFWSMMLSSISDVAKTDGNRARWPSGLRRQTKDQDASVSFTFRWNLVFRGVGSNPTLVRVFQARWWRSFIIK